MPWKDKDKIREYQQCWRQRPHAKQYQAEYRCKNRITIQKQSKNIRFTNKLLVLSHYTTICSWCGEDDILTLTIDHIKIPRKMHLDNAGYIISGSRIYTWLKKNNYPPGFQVLCMNCNYIKYRLNKLPEYRKGLHKQCVGKNGSK